MRAIAKDRLQAAIDAYRAKAGDSLEEHACDVLDRLEADGRAAEAFADILPNGERWEVLVHDCVMAEQQSRTHKNIIPALQERLKKAPDAIQAIKTLDDFFSMHWEPIPDDPITEALRILRVEIYYSHRHTEEYLATRSRKKDQSAARSAAIGWLKESVLRMSGKPNQKHVITLAEVTLGKRDLTVDAVRKAVTPSDARDGRRKTTAKNVAIATRKRKSGHSRSKNASNGP
jgi:hypothetical protein